jgi:hypothetical protein
VVEVDSGSHIGFSPIIGGHYRLISLPTLDTTDGSSKVQMWLSEYRKT